MFWTKTVALFIDDQSIRLLVTQGKKIKKWADTQLEPGMVKDSLVIKEAEVAQKIKQLLESQNVTSRKVIVGFSGLHSLTRPIALPDLPKAMLGEAVVREARRVLPVPLDQLYLSWHTLPCPKGRNLVFIAAIPRKNADTLIKTLQTAGLTPKRMTMKPLSLTKILPVNTALLVDMQATEFDIVVMVDGVSQPIRTVTFPDDEELTEAKKISLIANELDRTIKFYDSNNTDKPLPKGMPIYVGGELLGKPDPQKMLIDATGHPVADLIPDFKGVERIDLGRYLANVAMVVDSPSAIRASTFDAADMNLLPAAYQTKPPSLTKLVGIPAGAAVIGLAIYLVMSMQTNADKIADMQSQLDTTNQQINLKTKQQADLKAQIAEKEKSVAALKKQNEALISASTLLEAQHEIVNGDVSLTLSKLSPNIYLKNVSIASGNLTIAGVAPNKNDLYYYAQEMLRYARSLDQSVRFSESTLTTLSAAPSVQPMDVESGPVVATENITGIEFTLIFERGK